jgi:hypothetical protein
VKVFFAITEIPEHGRIEVRIGHTVKALALLNNTLEVSIDHILDVSWNVRNSGPVARLDRRIFLRDYQIVDASVISLQQLISIDRNLTREDYLEILLCSADFTQCVSPQEHFLFALVW